MAGVDLGEVRGRRPMDRDVNMIPFIDLLFVTIAFLLITAVWVTNSRINASAQVPSDADAPPEAEAAALHVHVEETGFVLTWKAGGQVIVEERLSRGPGERADLERAIAGLWQAHGEHRDPHDRVLDRCVFHSPDSMPFAEMVAIMDAIYGAKREISLPGRERQRVPAFQLALAAR